MIREGLHSLIGRRDVAGIYAFELVLKEPQKLPRGDGFRAEGEQPVSGDRPELLAGYVLRDLEQERAVIIPKEAIRRDALREAEAEAVAERGLHDRLGDAAHTGRIAAHSLARAQQLCHAVKEPEQGIRRRQPVRTVLRSQPDHAVPRGLELGGDDVAGLRRRHGEGDQRGRHVERFKRAAHRVLAADRRDAEPHLRLERAEQGGGGLAPALRVFAEALEVFLKAQIDVAKRRAG